VFCFYEKNTDKHILTQTR